MDNLNNLRNHINLIPYFNHSNFNNERLQIALLYISNSPNTNPTIMFAHTVSHSSVSLELRASLQFIFTHSKCCSKTVAELLLFDSYHATANAFQSRIYRGNVK